ALGELVVGLERLELPVDRRDPVLEVGARLGERRIPRRLGERGLVALLRLLELLLLLEARALLDRLRDPRAALVRLELGAPSADLLDELQALGRLLALQGLGRRALGVLELVRLECLPRLVPLPDPFPLPPH